MSTEGNPATEQVEFLSQRTPGHVTQWRDEHMPERRLYSTNAEFNTVVPDTMFDSAGADVPTEKRQAAVKELRGMLADTGLAPPEANRLLIRSAVVRESGASEEEQLREARKVLAQSFGKGADAALADARKLIARDPRFSKFINSRGIGNDAETILTLARAARSQRNSGKLK